MSVLYVLLMWHTMGWIKSYDVAGPWRSRDACERAGYQHASRWPKYSPGFQCAEVKMVEKKTENSND